MIDRKTMVIASLALIFLFNIMLNTFATSSEKTTMLYVGENGEYTTLGEAVSVAKDGDTIFIHKGLYRENITINKNISLVGENKKDTIIDGNGKGTIVTIKNCTVKIYNLTITNSSLSEDANISYASVALMDSSSSVFSNCIFYNSEIGLYIYKAKNVTINNCSLENNNGGLYILNSSQVNVTRCKLVNNKFYGISIINSFNCTISNCNISSNKGSGLFMRNSSFNTVFLNLFWNNSAYGLAIFKAQKMLSSNASSNKTAPPFFGGNATTVIDLPSIDNKVFRNNFIDNGINAFDGYNNSWDNDIVGNYWSDYYGDDENNDGIGDISYYFSSNRDRYPLMSPVSSAGLSNITPPEVHITYPENNATVDGIIMIYGEASAENKTVKKVLIRIDNEEWTGVNGTTNWSYVWNTTSVENGLHKIYVRSFDGVSYSRVESIVVNVKNTREPQRTPGFQFLTLLLIILISTIIYMFKQKH